MKKLQYLVLSIFPPKDQKKPQKHLQKAIWCNPRLLEDFLIWKSKGTIAKIGMWGSSLVGGTGSTHLQLVPREADLV